jgi:enamine deaminase RidA (YjgF/YER057c/UK114 family)
MKRAIISTPLAPAAIGTYSQAVRAGETVYLSGQIGLDPETMKLADGDRCADCPRLRQPQGGCGGCWRLAWPMSSSSTSTSPISSTFTTVNEVMGRYFVAPFPARAAVGVAALPRGALVEADAVMVIGG